jgi:hypothetical protein
MPCPIAYTMTTNNTTEDTDIISADSRSTTSVMPNGPMPGSVGPHPPTSTAIVPWRSVK